MLWQAFGRWGGLSVSSSGPTESSFTPDQLTPKWVADGSPSTLIVPNGTGGDWDLFIREIGNVIDEGTAGAQRYKLVYTGHADATYDDTTDTYIGWAYSSTGLPGSWTKGGRLITTRELEDPWLIKVGVTYYLYVEDKADTPFRNMRLYTSTDFSTWNDVGDILDIGASGTWEAQDVSSPVVWVEGSIWHMLYEGRKDGVQFGAVGHATSSDGITWTKDSANPVFEQADIGWAEAVVPDDIMVANDGTYSMLYHGYDGAVWRAAVVHSPDLYTWTDQLNNRSIRIDLASQDDYTVQFHPVGSSMYYIHARDAGSGIWQGIDMGYEVLVVNFTGSNGSTSFTDESAWGHTLTAGGNAQIQSNKLELDGSGDYVSSADSDRWNLFDVDYTMEFFDVTFDVNTSFMTLLSQYANTVGSQAFRFDYRGDLATDILRMVGSSFFDDSATWTPTVGVSYDICIERNGSTLRFYVDGTMLSSTTQSETFASKAATLNIGASFGNGTGEGFLDGRLAAVRFTNGKALYATNGSYTVPSLPI